MTTDLATTLLTLLSARYGSRAIELAHDLEWLPATRLKATEAVIEAALVAMASAGLCEERADGYWRVAKVEAELF